MNEAFAYVVLRFMTVLELDRLKFNVNGDATAGDHPLGASGAMILGAVPNEFEGSSLSTALVTVRADNRLGTATIIECN